MCSDPPPLSAPSHSHKSSFRILAYGFVCQPGLSVWPRAWNYPLEPGALTRKWFLCQSLWVTDSSAGRGKAACTPPAPRTEPNTTFPKILPNTPQVTTETSLCFVVKYYSKIQSETFSLQMKASVTVLEGRSTMMVLWGQSVTKVHFVRLTSKITHIIEYYLPHAMCMHTWQTLKTHDPDNFYVGDSIAIAAMKELLPEGTYFLRNTHSCLLGPKQWHWNPCL